MSDPSSTSGEGEKGDQNPPAPQIKPIEKIKPEFEKLPQIEKSFVKPEFKEHKPEFKEQKNEAKEHKPEFKEHKNEFKEHKNEFKEHKPEFKEQKLEIKEIKEGKLEGKELEKVQPDKGIKEQVEGGPLGGLEINPVAGLGREALEQQATALENAAQQLRHFIEQSDRPDTGGGALRNEPDQQD